MNDKAESIAHGLGVNDRALEKDMGNNYILEDAMCDFSMCVNSLRVTCFLAALPEPVIYLCCVSVQPA